jgi:putative flippase GtrA
MAALRMVRFAVTGAVSAGLFFSLTFALVRGGLPPFFSSLAGFVAAFGAGYALQHGWTFRACHSHRHAFPRYLSLQVVCSLLSGVIAHLAVSQFGLSALGMSVLTTLATSAVSLVGTLFWVFPNRAGARVELARNAPTESLF